MDKAMTSAPCVASQSYSWVAPCPSSGQPEQEGLQWELAGVETPESLPVPPPTHCSTVQPEPSVALQLEPGVQGNHCRRALGALLWIIGGSPAGFQDWAKK